MFEESYSCSVIDLTQEYVTVIIASMQDVMMEITNMILLHFHSTLKLVWCRDLKQSVHYLGFMIMHEFY